MCKAYKIKNQIKLNILCFFENFHFLQFDWLKCRDGGDGGGGGTFFFVHFLKPKLT